MTPLVATGLNGLVGSKFQADFSDRYSFDVLDIADPTRPIDITNIDQVQAAFAASSAKHVIHLAAYTDVTGAWEQRGDTSGLAYQVNVVGTQNIVAAAKATGKHVIHISTAYVFDGDQEEPYLETDAVNPIEWYGQTKAEAEEVVQNSTIDWTILRIDQPFRSDAFPKKDVVHRIIEGLKQDTLHPLFINHYFGPTFIDDFARVLDWVIRTNTTGLYHATAGEQWTDYQLAELIKKTHKLPGTIQRGDLDEYLASSTRPYQRNTALNTSLLFNLLDFTPRSIKEAVASVHV